MRMPAAHCGETSPHTRGELRAGGPQRSTRGKHPRIRGENYRHVAQRKTDGETSPHTRGEPTSPLHWQYGARNIPAYAGRTSVVIRQINESPKHPRIRGENVAPVNGRKSTPETSPHTRGELSACLRVVVRHRNIPAYAGRTSSARLSQSSARKHPRIRGENTKGTVPPAVIMETSPHTRGELRRTMKMSDDLRNIPAYAGRTMKEMKMAPPTRKHPRIRGENSIRMPYLV